MPGYGAVDRDGRKAQVRQVAVTPIQQHRSAVGSLSCHAVATSLFFCINIKLILGMWLVMLGAMHHDHCEMAWTVAPGVCVLLSVVTLDLLVPLVAMCTNQRTLLAVNVFLIPILMTFQTVAAARSTSMPGCDARIRRLAMGLNVFGVLFHAFLFGATNHILQSTIACPVTMAENVA